MYMILKPKNSTNLTLLGPDIELRNLETVSTINKHIQVYQKPKIITVVQKILKSIEINFFFRFFLQFTEVLCMYS